MTDKLALRAQLRAVRDKFAVTEGPFDAPDQFLGFLEKGWVVATYSPVGGEADPALFNIAVLATLGELALPHVVDRATPLRFLHWSRNARLVRGPFGLSQPDGDMAEVTPDIILTPLVGFDRRGNRLGQGAGHYDRAFAAHPAAIRIGIAYSVQEVDTLPADPWDVPLHHIATEKEWITPMRTNP